MFRFKKEYHTTIYILGLMLLTASLTLSQGMMSIAGFILVFNWLAEGNFRAKYNKLKSSKAALAFLLIFAIHIFGLFYTHNFIFALDDLRIKLPLLALPVIFVTTPVVSRKVFINILLVHVAATFVASLIGVGIYFTTPNNDMRDISIFISHIRFSLNTIGIYLPTQITDMRNISIFISHIRFSLNICVAILILIFLIFTKNNFKYPAKIGFALLIIWFIYFLSFMESFTGIIILSIVSSILLVVYILRKTRIIYKLLFLLFLILSGGGIYFYLNGIYRDYYKNRETVNPEKLEWYTPHGGAYMHNLENKLTDNGYYTWMYICDEELKVSWNNRSRIKFDSTDKQDQPIRFTLIRFLTSKGLRKDMDGVNSLTDQEIALIEDGVANIDLAKKGSFKNRLKNAIWEWEDYKITGDPRGRTMIQRVELWQSSVQLIKKHPWVGVGTGDAADVFAAWLIVQDSLLKKTNLRSHNQYLTIAIAFGIIGLMIFLFGLIYPAIVQRKFSDFLYLSFFLIAFLSMLTEDTLETQAGVTFFTFFSCLFLFVDKKSQPELK